MKNNTIWRMIELFCYILQTIIEHYDTRTKKS